VKYVTEKPLDNVDRHPESILGVVGPAVKSSCREICHTRKPCFRLHPAASGAKVLFVGRNGPPEKPPQALDLWLESEYDTLMMNMTKILENAPTVDTADALVRYNAFRASLGHGKVSRGSALLGAPTDNAKTAKTSRPTFTLSFAPHRDAAAILANEVPGLEDLNVCPWSTPGCRSVCVSYAGNGEYPVVQRLRAVKTAFAATDPGAFLAILTDEISRVVDKYGAVNFRLNTFSDVAWERVLPAEIFGTAGFYDYTKGGIKRYRAAAEVGYRLTLSVSERTNLATVDSWLAEGATAAVIFATKRGDALPAEWRGHRVVDGDISDNRLDDPAGSVVGLRAKGRLNYRKNENARVFIRGAAI
jgi:hypothetical protein